MPQVPSPAPLLSTVPTVYMVSIHSRSTTSLAQKTVQSKGAMKAYRDIIWRSPRLPYNLYSLLCFWRARFIIVELVCFHSNTDNFALVDVHPFGSWGIEEFVGCGGGLSAGEPEVCAFVHVAE